VDKAISQTKLLYTDELFVDKGFSERKLLRIFVFSHNKSLPAYQHPILPLILQSLIS